METIDAVKIVDKIAEESCTSLFQAYGVPLETVPASGTTAPALSAVIGFSGPGIRGTCILAASESPIKMSDPIGGSPRAWIAELSNQLVGRIKNKLLAHGAEVYVTTPVVLRAELLARIDGGNQVPPRAFASEGGNVFVWIELDTDPTLVLSPTPHDAAAVQEGDAVMF
jgi:CheY-specific phosphatase CheX